MGQRSTVESGVAKFEEIFTSWYGWARAGKTYREGKTRRLKLLARLDARRLRRALEREQPRF